MASNRNLKMLVVGVKDLPRNTSWLLSQAMRPVGATKEATRATMNSTGHGIIDTMRSAGVSVKEAVPGDSVEMRLQRARAAAERAQEAEDSSLQLAADAKARAGYAVEIAERDRSHVREVKSDQAKAVEQHVEEARRIADAQVEEARKSAQADAVQTIEREEGEAQKRLQKAREEAEAAQEKAQAELSRATALLTEARQLADEATDAADEATKAAKAAADQAHQQAEQLASTTHRNATIADQVVAEAEDVRSRSTVSKTAMTTKPTQPDTTADDA